MADKFSHGIKVGSTDVTVDFILKKTADSTEQTGKVAADLTAYYWRQGGSPTAIVLSDLVAINSAHSDGGVKEADATNMAGTYRLDLPDAVAVAGSEWVEINVKCANCFIFKERYQIVSTVANDVATTIGAAGAGLTGIASVGAVAGAVGSVTGNVGGTVASVVGAVGSVTGNVGGSVASVTGNVAGSVNSVATTVSADVVSISGDSVAADNLELAADGTGYNFGAGQIVAASVTGAVGSVTGAVASVTGSVGSVVGNVGGNVVGTVASVVGAVGSVIGSVGSVAGNVVGSVGSVVADVGITQAGADKVWTSATRTLTSLGTLASDVWAVATRTITGGTIGTYAGNTPQTGDAFARLGAPAGASVSADIAAVKAQTGVIQAKTDLIPAAGPASAADYTSGRAAKLDYLDVAISSRSVFVAATDGVKLTSAGLDAIVIETGVNARQAIQATMAASAGQISGADGTTVTLKNNAGTANRIVATVDAYGNRSAITLTLTA